MQTDIKWLAEKVAYIKGLKSPSEQQQLLVLLTEKPELGINEKKNLALIVKAEKAAERANKARVAAAAMIQQEKKALAQTLRKARTHELCESAGLMGLAGLIDTMTGKPTIDRDELLGALLGLASVPNSDPRRSQWRQAGAARLASTASVKQ